MPQNDPVLNIRSEIGKQIRLFRRSRKMTLDELASAIGKSKATLSKYEKGEISIDIETLYAIATAMNTHIEQLLCSPPGSAPGPEKEISPAFFRGLNKFYAYLYDGRVGKISRSVIDVYGRMDLNRYRAALYMNVHDIEH